MSRPRNVVERVEGAEPPASQMMEELKYLDRVSRIAARMKEPPSITAGRAPERELDEIWTPGHRPGLSLPYGDPDPHEAMQAAADALAMEGRRGVATLIRTADYGLQAAETVGMGMLLSPVMNRQVRPMQPGQGQRPVVTPRRGRPAKKTAMPVTRPGFEAVDAPTWSLWQEQGAKRAASVAKGQATRRTNAREAKNAAALELARNDWVANRVEARKQAEDIRFLNERASVPEREATEAQAIREREARADAELDFALRVAAKESELDTKSRSAVKKALNNAYGIRTTEGKRGPEKEPAPTGLRRKIYWSEAQAKRHGAVDKGYVTVSRLVPAKSSLGKIGKIAGWLLGTWGGAGLTTAAVRRELGGVSYMDEERRRKIQDASVAYAQELGKSNGEPGAAVKAAENYLKAIDAALPPDKWDAVLRLVGDAMSFTGTPAVRVQGLDAQVRDEYARAITAPAVTDAPAVTPFTVEGFSIDDF